MNINKVENTTNFKSGLTPEILKMEKMTQSAKVAEYFKTSPYSDRLDFEANLDFKDNKAYALACKLCANIFIQLRKMHNYRGICTENLVFPKGLYVFNYDEITDEVKQKQKNTFFTTISEDYEIFKDGKLADKQTILFDNKFIKSLEDANIWTEMSRREGFLSSKHFLHPFVHEWIHSIQNKIIFHYTHDFRYGDYQTTAQQHYVKKVDKTENEIVQNVLGAYAAKQKPGVGQYAEIFAEAWTKFICNSLNKECTGFIKDPIEELKKTPKEFRRILKKVSSVKPLSSLDCGDYEIVISWNNNCQEDKKDIISWNNKWDAVNIKKYFYWF